jgi:hypothetical protein
MKDLACHDCGRALVPDVGQPLSENKAIRFYRLLLCLACDLKRTRKTSDNLRRRVKAA